MMRCHTLLVATLVLVLAPGRPLLAAGAACGQVSVLLGASTVLSSNDTAVFSGGAKLSLKDRTLACSATAGPTSGSDALGAFTRTAWTWTAAGGDGTALLETATRDYGAGVVVYEQHFPTELSIGDHKQWLSTDFPSFTVQEGASKTTGIAYNGAFSKEQGFWPGEGIAKCKMGTQGGVVLVVEDDSTAAVAFSQLTAIKTGEIECTGHLAGGIKGTVTVVPAGFSASWVSVVGVGVKRTMEKWGDALLKFHGKARSDPYGDVIRSTLGFWTDNGGWFHYPPFKTPGEYESMLLKAVSNYKAQGLPVRHWQGDSWWYYKINNASGSSQVSSYGVYKWVADPFVLPKGMAAFHTEMGVPFILHNRWFCNTNWYMANGIAGKWTDSSQKHVLPYDLDALYAYFFTQQPGFGLATYEQDFMYSQYDGVPDMATNATFADEWLRAMANNAAKANLTMQYCMPYAREYLASTQFPNVATIRASGDYEANSDNWKILRNSLFAHAVGLLPFKDTFLSNNAAEPGGASRALGPELTPDLQTLVSVLSASIVAPGDGPGLLNKTRLMQTCRADGIVLKADRPSLPLDVAWTANNPGGELGFTVATSADGSLSTTYVLAADMEADYAILPAELELPADGTFVAYNWYTHAIAAFSKTAPLHVAKAEGREASAVGASPYQYQYFVVAAPLPKSGLVVIGEPNKFVTASSRRVAKVEDLTSGVTLALTGAPGEDVQFCAGNPTGHLDCQAATLDATGAASLTFHA